MPQQNKTHLLVMIHSKNALPLEQHSFLLKTLPYWFHSFHVKGFFGANIAK
jgi:hypothetical protein